VESRLTLSPDARPHDSLAVAWLASASGPQLLAVLDWIVATHPAHDPSLVDACVAAIERDRDGSVALDTRLGAQSRWHDSCLGRWIVARAYELREDWSAAERAWSEVLAKGDANDHGASNQAHLARALVRHRRGDLAAAYSDLRDALLGRQEHAFLERAARLYARLRAKSAPPAVRRLRVAYLSGSLTELVGAAFQAVAFRDGIDADLYVPPFGSFRQAVLDEQSALHAFAPQVVIIATHWRDAGLAGSSTDPASEVARVVGELQRLWAVLVERHGCLVIQHSFDLPTYDAYGPLSSTLPGGRVRVLRAINEAILRVAPPSVAVLDTELVRAQVGGETWTDWPRWHAIRQHPGPAALPALVEAQVALVRAAQGLGRKVLVLDLDNVMWGGIIGEDGLDGIEVGAPSATGEAHRELQLWARELRDRGIVLAVCSKNDLADARLPFEKHEGMVLAVDDFAAFKANWTDKATNLREIHEALNLGLESFVFVDDNPVERALIRRELPMVAVPELPADPAGYVQAIEAAGYFAALRLSDEDRARAESYRVEAQRQALQATATSLDAYLASLGMVAARGAFDEASLGRIAQLVGKTNQFNLTSRRHSEEALRRMATSPAYWTHWFRLKDRFGDYGLIGAMVATAAREDVWEIDTWLMSCRVIGRQMEDFMLEAVTEAARARGARVLIGLRVPTPKNGLVAELYLRLGFDALPIDADGTERYRLELSAAPRRTHHIAERPPT
jgi:FkbH-like protein